MAERSQFWTTGTTGDGTTTITETQTIEWFRDILAPFASAGPNTASGPLAGVLNELAVSGASSPVAVATGAAVVEGFFYVNDASVNVAIPTPAASTRIDRIVLRASHGATRTVRITRIAGTEGAGAPALTQVAGTTWDIPLAQVSITTGGVITVTDQRTFCYYATKVKTAMLDDDAVSDIKLRNSAALSVIGRSANSSGDPADISTTNASAAVLRESGGTLGFGTVATAGIANDAVDDTKVGNRVPMFTRRQGGSASSWLTAGTTTQTPTTVKMQSGVFSVTVAGGSISGDTVITFPQAFSQVPMVIVSFNTYTTNNFPYVVSVAGGVSATGCTIRVERQTSVGADTFTICWLAIGTE